MLEILHPLEVFLEPHYEVLRALHIIAIISWMAGLLYLPRLFVYHAEEGHTPEMRATFKKMERRLLNYIMHPAMVVSWLTGIGLLLSLPGWGPHVWMIIKGLGAVLLTVMHFVFARQVALFAQDKNTRSGRFYRIINEIPTVFMIIMVLMVVLEPWDTVLTNLFVTKGLDSSVSGGV